MSSDSNHKKKTDIKLMEEDIEKGLNEKKALNLVLKKMLDEVAPDGTEQPENRGTKDKSNK